MSDETLRGLERIRVELHEGIRLAKCRKCGCMQEALEHLQTALSRTQAEGTSELFDFVRAWQRRMKPIQYSCLGCEYCYPAVALNALQEALPEAAAPVMACAFEPKEGSWPIVPGEYVALCEGPSCPVAVSTLASVDLVERLVAVRPRELCIVGKTETENIGLDKIIKNTITNPDMRNRRSRSGSAPCADSPHERDAGTHGQHACHGQRNHDDGEGGRHRTRAVRHDGIEPNRQGLDSGWVDGHREVEVTKTEDECECPGRSEAGCEDRQQHVPDHPGPPHPSPHARSLFEAHRDRLKADTDETRREWRVVGD